MARMKTLTVSGQTYTVNDPEAVSFAQSQALTPLQQGQARENMGVWSGKETADRLCPGFSAKGAAVVCAPVEGYPLEAVSYLTADTGHTAATLIQRGKNLLPAVEKTENKANGISAVSIKGNTLVINCDGTGTGSFHFSALEDDGVLLQPGTYTWSISHVSGTVSDHTQEYYIGLYLSDNSGWLVYRPMYGVHGYRNNDAATFTVTKPTKACFRFVASAQLQFADCTFQLQLEAGDTATAFEQYREGNVYTVAWEQPVYGGSFNWSTGVLTDPNGNTTQLETHDIVALSGINTLYSDTGETEVTGRADPVAIIAKMTNAILSLGGNV